MTQATAVGLDISLAGPGICIAVGDPRKQVGENLSAASTVIRAGEDLRGPERLSIVSGAIWSWLQARKGTVPGDLFVMEGYAFSRQHAHSIGEIGGCVRKRVWEAGGNLLIVPPSVLKKFLTGKGAGDKNIVMKHVFKRWGYDVDDDNQCDAFGCSVIGLLDQLGPDHWTADERDMLTKRVQRFAGKGQRNWAPVEIQKTRKVRR